mmetsp:Transcript_57470/g.124918  ORF Transcript_57470/g.124918 Transcript_57470/m.124918 type:complete len:206 (+) Transcript_57470:1-618(+)
MSVDEGEVIVKQGDAGLAFFFLAIGEAEIFLEKPEGGRHSLELAGPGTSFGAQALIYNKPRSATIVATKPCLLWRLGKEEFLSFHKMAMVNTASPPTAVGTGDDPTPRHQTLARLANNPPTSPLQMRARAARLQLAPLHAATAAGSSTNSSSQSPSRLGMGVLSPKSSALSDVMLREVEQAPYSPIVPAFRHFDAIHSFDTPPKP